MKKMILLGLIFLGVAAIVEAKQQGETAHPTSTHKYTYE